MKEGIHPSYNEKIKATCSCGATFEVGSTAESLTVEVCSKCHPFYTGKQKLVDAAGRIDKFKKRLEQADKLGKDKPKTKKAKKKVDKEDAEIKL